MTAFNGGILLSDETFAEMGATAWRSRCIYVSQTRCTQNGTPQGMLTAARSFQIHKNRTSTNSKKSIEDIFHKLGLEESCVNQPWSKMSGGQAARALLGVSLALEPDVLLLDEPTSALDANTSRLVEKALVESKCAILWVSHEAEQPARLSGRIFSFGQEQTFLARETSILIEGKEQKLREEKRKILDSKMNDPSNSGKNDNPNNCENWLLAGTLFTLVIIRILWEALKWPGYEILAGSEAPPSSECIDGDEVVNITPTILFFGYVVMIGAIGLGSYFYELDLINTIVVAASRCVLQLSFLGFLLVPIFEVDNEALNVTYVFVMMIIATHEAMKRPKYSYFFCDCEYHDYIFIVFCQV
jgi:ABC-type iron transport system FetAB ATPase subunit